MNALTIGIASVAFAALGVAVWALWRALVAERALRELHRQFEDVAGRFQGLSAGSVGQGQHLARLESDVARLRDRLDRLGNQEGGDAAFGHAIRMARRGSDVDEIMEACGLSRMEADLVVRLHHQGQQAVE